MPLRGRPATARVGLVPRVFGLLLLVLVPLGVISVYQTRALEKEVRRSTGQSLLLQTAAAAAKQRVIVQRALGAAEFLASLAVVGSDDEVACSATMRGIDLRSDEIVFAGYIPPSGIMTCHSGEGTVDFSGSPTWERAAAEPRDRISVSTQGRVSEDWVLIASVPVFREREFAGYASVSVPYSEIAETDLPVLLGDTGPVVLATFNGDGEVITVVGDTDGEPDLPAGMTFDDLRARAGTAFEARDPSGAHKVWAVAPVVPGTLYALGVFEPIDTRVFGAFIVPAGLFPVLMWLATLGVSYLALNRLVIRPIRHLGRQMHHFATSRSLPPPAPYRDTPRELAEIEYDFREMATAILQDEAALEDALRDKAMLLKEVHHRVRNNLQMISSMISMQLRRIGDSAGAGALERLQNRILSLAAVHRALYESEDMSHVPVDKLLREIFDQQTADIEDHDALDVQLDIEPLGLVPDQAVPLALLVAEALANAVEHLPRDKRGRLCLTLSREGKTVRLTMANSVSTADDDLGSSDTGVGTNLMQAFAAQLSGTLTHGLEDGEYHVRLAFDVVEQIGPALDY